MDGTVTDCSFLENSCSGTNPAPVWIIGGGPSLLNEACDKIQASPAPKFAMNLAGRGRDGEPPLIRPNFWTSYDPTSKFHRSIFLDSSIDKFALAGRYKDLIPGGTEKLCDCPRVFFVERENRGYADFLGSKFDHVVNCRDSFIQAIDIAYRLGFRVFYCVGVDMMIRPSDAQIELALSVGVQYDRSRSLTTLALNRKNPDVLTKSDMLRHFLQEYHLKSGLPTSADAAKSLEEAGREKQYSFDVQKPFSDACSMDGHMWERVQFLRQARRNLSLCGVQLFSCTAGSRLNDYFPYISVAEAIRRVERYAGVPSNETTKGRYETVLPSIDLPYHKDVPPLAWDQTVAKRGLNIDADAAEQNKPPAKDIAPRDEAGEKADKNEARAKIASMLQELDGFQQNGIVE